MIDQLLDSLSAMLIAVTVSIAFYYAAYFGLEKVLSSKNLQGEEKRKRDQLRLKVQPFIFVGPALILLTIFLVYPVIETFRLSMYDRTATEFVSFSNYSWAFGDEEFSQAIINNILWLIFVPTLSTGVGLVIAYLADRIWWGQVAKTLIFLPMAISFVGASVIWRFVYDYRGADSDQIGLLNAIVVALGGEPQAWIALPFWNNLLLMVILIWIQTGFAMVLLGAAMRGVSEEVLEAAKLDGANDFQIFLKILVPQIIPTILVVWTTITILVLKVFDIVLTMTNGQWDTEVMANLMFDWMFRGGGDFGKGSAIAVVLMIAVIPVMLWNIKKAREE
ncbi:carbohydrate ABC transporter permease [Vibrio nigripulchritudo]|uniref:carbohydrate ABC transporter permease n=1 Tax=Vibrio nigripulchritudo TaxID=28173 RepID=UPI0012D4110B|nr:sugar ABC transporter permease [Vibrio nigripulchritudo]